MVECKGPTNPNRTGDSGMYKGNLLKHLRAFIQTSRTRQRVGSRRTSVPQPAFNQSADSSAGREKLDRPLFTTRHGPRMHLTPRRARNAAGGRMARPLVDRLDALPDDFARLLRFTRIRRDPDRGRRVDHHAFAAGHCSMRFRRKHPGIFVHLHNVDRCPTDSG